MKNVQRILSLALALLMVFALAACTGTSDPGPSGDKPDQGESSDKQPSSSGSEDPVNPEVEGFVLPDRPVDDMKDKNYIIIQHQVIEQPFGYAQDSLLAQQANARVEEVQNLYGCTLEFAQIPYGDDFATQFQALTFAENGGDLVFSHNQAKLRLTLGKGGSESLLVELLPLDHIINFWDMDKWGGITARETMMAGGYFYGVAPNLWINYTPLPYYQVVYNKELLPQFEATDPQELWEQEKWDRDAMLDLIVQCYDDSGSDNIWGMTGTLTHMMRATFLTTGQPTVIIDKINADRTVEWSHGLDTPDAKEALGWLQDALVTHAPHFNDGKEGGWDTWKAHEPLISGYSVFALTRPSEVLNNVVMDMSDFGLTLWAGADANVVSGYYENSSAISIPIFAQNSEHSAFLMYDLFEGLGEVETMDDVVEYYRSNYFASDLDVEFLLRTDANNLQYSYWPNGGGDVWPAMSPSFLSAASMATLIGKNKSVIDGCIEDYQVANKVTIEAYRQNGYFN